MWAEQMGPHSLLLNYWLFVDSGSQGALEFCCVPYQTLLANSKPLLIQMTLIHEGFFHSFLLEYDQTDFNGSAIFYSVPQYLLNHSHCLR